MKRRISDKLLDRRALKNWPAEWSARSKRKPRKAPDWQTRRAEYLKLNGKPPDPP